MILKTLSLVNFRNHKKKQFDFSEKVTFIIGKNASGKTNILESIFLLATGKSFKARREEEMVMIATDIARVKGIVSSGDDISANTTDMDYLEKTSLEVVLTRGFIDLGTATPQKAPKKRLLLDDTPKRLVDFAGQLKVVVFGPWDMDLVTDSPSVRRDFLDTVLTQTDREYRRCQIAYEKGLRQRNKLLYRIREEGISRSQLVFWNQLLIRNGEYISRKREEFIDFVNDNYQLSPTNYKLIYDRSVISESRLEQYKIEEVASATTLVGPHRDDFIFKIIDTDSKPQMLNEERDLSIYGSRGEQRMGILWLKLSELDYIEDKSKEKPVLLLDDIFSELDHPHRDVVMSVIKKQQTIMTTADPHYVEGIEEGKRIEL